MGDRRRAGNDVWRWLACVAGIAIAARANATATLRAVRQITTPTTTRLIIELSEPVRYQLQRLTARPELGVPPRVYVDLLDTRLPEATRIPLGLAEGPLVRLRSVQADARSTRLILDVPGLTDYGAFPMLDPFRLIIDVRGTPRVAPHPHAAAVTVEPSTRHDRPASTSSARRIKVVLDPGHGGKDPGALGIDGLAEKDVVLSIAQRLKERLAALPNLDVVLTRDRDVFLALEERTARANAERADLFVSIHGNASTNTDLAGIETYYLNNTNDRATLRLAAMENGLRAMTGSQRRDRDATLILSDMIQNYKVQESAALAEDVQRALVAQLEAQGTPTPNLGVKRGPFYVLVGAGMPCVLVEVSFLTHPEEGVRLATHSYQDAIADGLLRGIRRFVENSLVAENL